MQLFRHICLILLPMAILTSCKDKLEDGKKDNEIPLSQQIQITLEPFYDLEPISLEQTVFTTDEGYRVKLREFKVYISDIKNGEYVLGDHWLYNRENSSTLLLTPGEKSNFPNLSFKVGVPESKNHSDPSSYPNNHALNIINANDMHWSWNPGYIFFKLEMIADTTADNTDQFNHIISYHVGQDEALREVTLSNLNWQNGGPKTDLLRLKLDLKKVFKNGSSIVDLKTESVTHSSPETMALTNKLATNFANSITSY